MMSGMARKSLGAAVGDGKGGLAFYEFSDIADTRGFIDEWYVCLRGYFSDASRRRRGGDADSSPTRRGDAAAATRIIYRRVAATPRRRRG